ncbi:hypothetical protein L596_010290 [Steinernema carpocapsae]|uniref:Uncharacterized protein n=1 Tax=Steinernema carpocapsae TaxID=34508 RepID=A0A4U5PIM2_STECR|nr:hypothetical protein L596_010290 [Steinernema carpocapsae]
MALVRKPNFKENSLGCGFKATMPGISFMKAQNLTTYGMTSGFSLNSTCSTTSNLNSERQKAKRIHGSGGNATVTRNGSPSFQKDAEFVVEFMLLLLKDNPRLRTEEMWRRNVFKEKKKLCPRGWSENPTKSKRRCHGKEIKKYFKKHKRGQERRNLCETRFQRSALLDEALTRDKNTGFNHFHGLPVGLHNPPEKAHLRGVLGQRPVMHERVRIDMYSRSQLLLA